MMTSISRNRNTDSAKPLWLNNIAEEKTTLLKQFFEMEPIHVDIKDPVTKKLKPRCQGEEIIYAWDECYANDPMMKNIVIDTMVGPSTPGKDYYDASPINGNSSASTIDNNNNVNPVMPYQQLRALVGDGGKWKWPKIWKNIDTLPRRGRVWRHIDDPANLGTIANPNPDIVPLNCLIVGGGPVGIRLAIELSLGGHRVTIFEKRREERNKEGFLVNAGFTNRVNRPHINNFCRNDLDRLNGRNFMTPKMCYPVFTNSHTSSIGIDEAQMMLLKTALLLGVNFELGVGYVTAEIDIENKQTQSPSWMVEYTADEIACTRYGKEKEGTQRFDALFGCDGGNSKVRKTQVDWLGTPRTRKYKRMYGIVSNLRKCSRTKLKSMGFDSGLEPEDIAGLKTGVYFYKASYHNYLIVHPSKDEMEQNGIPWKGIFCFKEARDSAISADSEQKELKESLKKFIVKKAEELNIPLDETLPNGGFVEAPNDVMGFDFSEFYNCEKSAMAIVPPLEWNKDQDGEWKTHCPLIALAGDSVADPNWLLGVGLQRGWNSCLDACFYADNLYNNKSFNGKPPSIDEPINGPVEWSSHLQNLANLMTKLGSNSREGKLSKDMGLGMHSDAGPVVIQMKKAININVQIPQYSPVLEPWYRYKGYEVDVGNNYKGSRLFENIHPTTQRELAIFKKNADFVKKGMHLRRMNTRLTWSSRFECSTFWCDMSMKLLQIDGKVAPTEKTLDKKVTSTTRTIVTVERGEEKIEGQEESSNAKRPILNLWKVKQITKRKSDNYRNGIVGATVSPCPSGIHKEDRNGINTLMFQVAEKGGASCGGDDVDTCTKVNDDIDVPKIPTSSSIPKFQKIFKLKLFNKKKKY